MPGAFGGGHGGRFGGGFHGGPAGRPGGAPFHGMGVPPGAAHMGGMGFPPVFYPGRWRRRVPDGCGGCGCGLFLLIIPLLLAGLFFFGMLVRAGELPAETAPGCGVCAQVLPQPAADLAPADA